MTTATPSLALQVPREMTIIPADNGATTGINALTDGDSFTIDDGVNRAVRFEFDKDGLGVTFGSRAINVFDAPGKQEKVVFSLPKGLALN